MPFEISNDLYNKYGLVMTIKKMTSHKVLITGISGFVGPYLARQLIDSGNEVTGLVLRRAGGQKPQSLIDKGIGSDMQLIAGDITDLTSVLSAVQKAEPDWIFHLAAQSFVRTDFGKEYLSYIPHLSRTRKMLSGFKW
jgi:GDP-D-mannose dehydratase